MIIQWKKYIFTINDIYGTSKDAVLPKADVHAYFQQSDLIDADKKLALHKKVKTLCIDLQKSEEQLRKEMNRTTRYQINKAGKDNLKIKHLSEPTKADIVEFATFFNPFAKEKGIEICREDKVKALQRSNRLVISYVFHPDGRKLASHLYIIDGNRATMLYSCSGRFTATDIPPLEIGRANRFLHWQDILYFKQEAYATYDFLGLSINEKDKDQQNINKFKKGFGGREEFQFQSFVPQTKLGIVMLFLLRIKWHKQIERIQRGSLVQEIERKQA